MTTPISPQRIAEIRRHYGDLSHDAYSRNHPITLGHELLAEVDRLNRLLAETRTEWGVEWGSQRSVYPYDNEATARSAAADHHTRTPVCRLVGPWREAAAPEAGGQ